MQLHISAHCSAPDELPSTPGILRVYSRCYTRITLGVMQGRELHVPWYHVIYGYVSYDMYVIYIYHMLLSTVCHATRFLRIHTPTHLRQLILR